ncbi:MAG TPA: hypothetical protein PKW79_05495 [Rhabdochlamydiaceae bacterium]|nr:hypothetical protein [Rhabdochlamydiaceae bacterium]
MSPDIARLETWGFSGFKGSSKKLKNSASSSSLSETLDTNTLSDPRSTSPSQSSSRTSQTNTPSLNTSRSITLQDIKIPPETFGPEDWNRYFGDIGAIPPLPWNITTILGSPCPIWGNTSVNSLKVQDTHLLTLIPKTVNGTNLTLPLLGTIVQKPQSGGNKTGYSSFHLDQAADTSSLQSYWVLMTKDIIPNSRAQTYTKQLLLLQNHPGYEVPKLLEAVTTLFMHYVKTGERLYADNPSTWTRCQEKYNSNWQTCVGGFAPAGLNVWAGGSSYYTCVDGESHGGVGGLRKF